MAIASFIVGTLFGAVFLSTIPTTARVIDQVSPYATQGIQWTIRLLEYFGGNL